MNETITYYNKNAESFIQDTVSVEFTETQDKFLYNIPKGASILDFGCGSGRDAKYFMEQGFEVEATDGSTELCVKARKLAGTEVKCMMFQELDEDEKYHGIWACSSILHLSKDELKEVIEKMRKALTPHGIIYTSFKYGEFEGLRNGRYFTDFTEEVFRDFMKEFTELEIEELWITGDVRPDRSEEKWLNIILRKK